MVFFRITNSQSRVIGTEQFINKYSGIIPEKFLIFKADTYGDKKNYGFFSGFFRYSPSLSIERVRCKLRIG